MCIVFTNRWISLHRESKVEMPFIEGYSRRPTAPLPSTPIDKCVHDPIFYHIFQQSIFLQGCPLITSLLAHQIDLLLYYDSHFITTIAHFLADFPLPHHFLANPIKKWKILWTTLKYFSTQNILTFAGGGGPLLFWDIFQQKLLTFFNFSFLANSNLQFGSK